MIPSTKIILVLGVRMASERSVLKTYVSTRAPEARRSNNEFGGLV